jgi:aryl-alcohol dehydrogenase-like predicted oxidoreductase
MYFPGTLFANDETRAWHRTHQFPMLAWASLASGFISGKFKSEDTSNEQVTQMYYSEENFERLRRAQELGAPKNATSLQVGLAYVLHQAFPVIALVGPATVANLNETFSALNVELTQEEMNYLDLKTP